MKNAEYCSICGKELNFWFTSLKKIDGKKVCSGCGTKLVFDEYNEKSKQITETKATCIACGNIWYYGKQEQKENFANSMSQVGKSMMCCGGCMPALLIPDKKITDLNKCQKCGSKAVKKEVIVHDIK